MVQVNRQIRVLSVAIALLVLSACSAITRERPEPGQAEWAPVPPQSMEMGSTVTGSIYQTHRNFSFYGDQVALNVGDILTVVLQESTSASKSADTEIEKNSEQRADESTVLGNLVGFKGLSTVTNAGMDRSFEGAAKSDQSNSLRGSISVTISEVLPNGVLRIRGEKWLKLNQGDEYIRLTGLVRPEDIGTDNTIPSSKVADARIAYGGTGEFDDANRMGWLSRFFNSEWWIF